MERDEAINVVRSNFPNGRIQLSEALKTLIPELRENEDEKIRKSLIENFKFYGGDDLETSKWGKNDELYVPDIIAWLEKQNHDNKKWIYEDVYIKEKEQLIQDGIDEVLENPQKYGLEKQGEKSNPYSGVSFEYNGHTWGMCARDNGVDISLDNQLFIHLDEQGEWTEDDTHTLNWICRIIYRAKQDRLITPEEEISLGKWMDKWLNHNPEWNEPDKKMLGSIIECIDGTGLLDSDQINWLKSLKPHKDSLTEKQRGYIKFLESVQIGDEVTRNSDGAFVNLSQLKRVINSETPNNIGPKFKVGDWITCDEFYPLLITNIKNNRYEIEFIDGDKRFSNIDCMDSDFHLWTIRDAKAGDVLINHNNENTFIFKGLLDPKHPNCPVAYCGIDVMGEFMVSPGDYFWGDINVKPATKEQRDVLFQKMEDAGYKWDAENKVLIKQCDQETINGIKPKFGVGNWIVEKDLDNFGRGIIVAIRDGRYILNTGYSIPIAEQDAWQLVQKDV